MFVVLHWVTGKTAGMVEHLSDGISMLELMVLLNGNNAQLILSIGAGVSIGLSFSCFVKTPKDELILLMAKRLRDKNPPKQNADPTGADAL